MNIIDITKENKSEYLPSSEWLAEDIERGRFLALGAKEDGKPAGAVVWSIRKNSDDTGNRGELHQLDGSEAAMEALLDEYTARARIYDVRSTVMETSDKKMNDFLEEHGFFMDEDESATLCVEVGDFADNPGFKDVKIPESIVALEDVASIEFRYFIQKYSDKLCSDLLYEVESVPIERYEREISCVSLADEGIDAAFLVRDDGNGTLYPEILASLGDLAQKKLPYLLAFSISEVLRKYPADTKIMIRRSSKAVSALVKKILKGKKGETVYLGIRD